MLTTWLIFMQIVDLATLTGACIVALGPSIAGMFACASSCFWRWRLYAYVLVSLPFNHIFSCYFDCKKIIIATLNAHVEERKSSESFDWCFNSEFCLPEFYWISCIQNTGVFTPSDDLAKEVAAASEVSGEKLWRMPLEESYWDTMKSGVADMVNTGGRQGGAIVAALFLKQVVTLSL